MATYKVIQDIEADDKLLGPLTLRQFVYAGITVGFLYLSYIAIAKGAAFMLVIFLPPAILTGFFAFPWGREQPTEIWALARIRFMLKPRRRIWDQTGMKELVTITVPKRIERVYTDGLTQTEVKSRLQALASTIDSRGWVIKNTNGPYSQTPVLATIGASSERLIDPGSLAQAVPADDTTVYDDVLSEDNNQAQHFDTMLAQSAQVQRERLMASMQQSPTDNSVSPQPTTSATSDYWLLNNPSQQSSPQPQPPAASDDQALVEQLKSQADDQSMQYSHLPTILPLSEQEKQTKAVQPISPTPQPPVIDQLDTTLKPVTPEPDAAILELATKDDWNISTIARQAKKAHGEEPEEVVISLH